MATKTYRFKVVRKTILQTKVQTRLTLGDELKSPLTFIVARDESSHNRSLSHLALLRSFPTIWMTENKVDVLTKWVPEVFAVRITADDEIFGTAKKIVQEVCEYLFDQEIWWKWGYRRVDRGGQISLGSKMKFKPWYETWDRSWVALWSLLPFWKKRFLFVRVIVKILDVIHEIQGVCSHILDRSIWGVIDDRGDFRVSSYVLLRRKSTTKLVSCPTTQRA